MAARRQFSIVSCFFISPRPAPAPGRSIKNKNLPQRTDGGIKIIASLRYSSATMHAPLLTPEILLRAYAEGLFPMAERRDDPTLYWVSPEKRGIIPLDGFHTPRRLARTIRSG